MHIDLKKFRFSDAQIEDIIWRSCDKSITESEDAWQKTSTSFSICKQMTDLVEISENEVILILFNVELIYELLKRNVKQQSIYFVADSIEKKQFIDDEFPEINLRMLEKHTVECLINTIKDFNMKKFDIAISNPPYSGPRELANIDVRIFNEIINLATEVIFIKPCAPFTSYFWNDVRDTHPDVIAKKSLRFLKKIIIVPSSIFNGNCAKENDLAILYFDKNKIQKEIDYYDKVKNITKFLKSENELSRWTSFNFSDILTSIKEKIDKWISTKTDFFINHHNGGDYGRKPKNIEKLTIVKNNMSAFSFWLPTINGASCNYLNSDASLNKYFCAINRGTEKHKQENFSVKKDIDYIFSLGSNRLLFNADSKKEAERNWKFIITSPIVKIILAIYREDRLINFKWIPWLKKDYSFKDLCNEIGLTKDEINFLKSFFKDVEPISWE